ncbi:ArsR/SmtB family transcription factor [Streptomyces sp. AN091965]|uniref:ArsR/SmtB family transcription factor n=1 Tax=Streptomyces sp. AN091965 TaxID=2927803 RepID=UPI001F61CC3C|nr:winged helix-turn-helix domain-containing protein [Streptomyces sp. AN091965]MCI3928353.1 helix-turn-helix domain-containing protein [Streptomyces sp. AN091965]
MVYRIHFTVDDLARTRVSPCSLPLMELAAAVRTLQQRGQAVRFGAWRRRALTDLRPEARMVLELVRARRWAPDFLTRAESGSPEDVLERVRATPRSRIRSDLAHVAADWPLPPWARHLADDRDLFRRLCDSLDHVYDVLLSPHWQQIASSATTEGGTKTRQALTGGMEHLLSSANPHCVRWNAPVLEVTMASGLDGDLLLEGRGLLLVPSYFGPRWSAVCTASQPQPVLTYPAHSPWDVGSLIARFPHAEHHSTPPSALAALLGPTRAAVLNAVAEHPGCSTNELAVLTGVAPSNASRHATTLRRAGLVHTVRYRNTALHTVTGLGTTLLDSPCALPDLHEG